MYRSIQFCRAIAALLVLCFHTGGNLAKDRYFGATAAPLDRLFSFGNAGVEFFFVLSGFIITLVHRRDFSVPDRLLPYVRKRVTRIYPTYLIVFVTVYLLASAVPAFRATLPHDVGILVRSLLLVPQDSAVVGGTGAPVILVAWSLQYEMVFYALVALAILGRLPALVALIALGVNFLIFNLYRDLGFPQSFFASNLMWLFGLGAAASYALPVTMPSVRPAMLAVVGAAAFLCLGALEVGFGKPADGIDHTLAYGVFSAVLVFGLARWETQRPSVFANRAYALLGDASYALYLVHFPLVALGCKAAVALGARGFGGALLSFFAIVPLTLGVAVVFHLVVERPVMAALARRGSVRASADDPRRP